MPRSERGGIRHNKVARLEQPKTGGDHPELDRLVVGKGPCDVPVISGIEVLDSNEIALPRGVLTHRFLPVLHTSPGISCQVLPKTQIPRHGHSLTPGTCHDDVGSTQLGVLTSSYLRLSSARATFRARGAMQAHNSKL